MEPAFFLRKHMTCVNMVLITRTDGDGGSSRRRPARTDGSSEDEEEKGSMHEPAVNGMLVRKNQLVKCMVLSSVLTRQDVARFHCLQVY